MGKRGRQRSSAYVDPRDIEGCEALLEAHFTQVLLSPCLSALDRNNSRANFAIRFDAGLVRIRKSLSTSV